jgi:WD40 repeat protein
MFVTEGNVRLFLRIVVALAVSTVAFRAGVQAQNTTPPQDPILRIDPGMHTARIDGIGVGAACTLLATGSEDKTVRLWRLPEGKLLNTYRPPIGPGDDGKLFAVAIAPDARWVAAGGYTTSLQHFIYVFQTGKGIVMTRLGPLPNLVNHLAVSPDGRFLAATISGGEGLRVWRRTGASLDGWQLVAEDTDYGGKDPYGAAFGPNGVLYTAAFDGKLRRYAPGYTAKPIAVATNGGGEPISVAVHPAGKRVAVSFLDSTAVEVYDATTLARRFAPDTKGVNNGNFFAVSWSADGARLYAGGTYGSGQQVLIRVWDRAGEGSPHELVGSVTTIMALVPCGDGIAVGATDPAFGLIAADGSRRFWQESVHADMRGKRFEHFTVSSDGSRIRFGLKLGGGEPVLFDLAAERMSDAPSPIQDLHFADTQSLPHIEGHETARSLAITPDGRRFLGADFSLRAFDKDLKPLWGRAVPGAVWGVNLAQEGKLVVAAYDDGTIRWHRASDGAELLALFVHAKDRRWVAWTPKGYYTASAGGESLIGWHVNRGWEQAADFFAASQFRNTFYRPDVVQNVLIFLDEDKAVALANEAAKLASTEVDVRSHLPPVVTILSPTEGASFASSDLTLEYAVRSPSGLPVDSVRALIDGRPAEGAENKGFVAVRAAETKSSMHLIGLPARNVKVSLIAEAGDLTSLPVSVGLVWKGAPALMEEDLKKGKMYALLVGVGRYKDSQIKQLKWAAQDARDMNTLLERQRGKLYRDVEVRLLTEEDATRDAVIDGLEWLKRSTLKGDVAILFMSGHGATDERANYYFVPHDAELDTEAGLFLPKRSRAVPDT